MGPPLTNGRPAADNRTDLFQMPRKLPPETTASTTSSAINDNEFVAPLPPNATPNSAVGGDIQHILNYMKFELSTAPLTKIAATPRTEIEAPQTNKKHVYAELPPHGFKPPMKPRKFYVKSM